MGVISSKNGMLLAWTSHIPQCPFRLSRPAEAAGSVGVQCFCWFSIPNSTRAILADSDRRLRIMYSFAISMAYAFHLESVSVCGVMP